ncbi:hypothetical protein F4813DRAFT_392845 [Daldinia decipiens]|uniref:uncharacterized protein n=1 Tax=Daldinia decipiens TaxID=326647 RepID=UPI0020C58B10|nr:uncharacterized protein F4813DRAFT_392845 [Daldinia decipiens]KAI1654340.1 hypothetical protein F4813DRAFT_392845 [Daldinia decipiens]
MAKLSTARQPGNDWEAIFRAHEPENSSLAIEWETEKRFNEFADLFLVKKDVYKAFEYILPEYINHNPLAQNGAQYALDLLGPIWGNQSITVFRTKFEGNMSWLNYKNSFGEIVDRYRWEDGCIMEHWDQGEEFPTT